MSISFLNALNGIVAVVGIVTVVVQLGLHIRKLVTSPWSSPERGCARMFVTLFATYIALAFLAVAVASITQNQSGRALILSITGIAVLAPTKVGAFLLAVIKGVPVWLGAKFVSDKVYERIKRNKKQPEK
jgi:hypothetical protein